MGEDMVNRIEKDLGWKHVKPATANLSIHGFEKNMDWNDPLYFYGSDAKLIRQQMTKGKKIINEYQIMIPVDYKEEMLTV